MNIYYYKHEEPYLMHYGVKGMKWGVRKDGTLHRKYNSVEAVTKKTGADKEINKEVQWYRNVTGSTRSKQKKSYQHRNVDEMSDDELRTAINRLQMEKKYRQLTSFDFKRGKKIVDGIKKTKKLYDKYV